MKDIFIHKHFLYRSIKLDQTMFAIFFLLNSGDAQGPCSKHSTLF